ncbi:MAG: class I SAM-dependent methyltransferase [Planctomycetaceae bacterium]|jgi:hypothetical protein|nr:class I SAM-dependent methyltransferase [Planctomycetaceae bacterium]
MNITKYPEHFVNILRYKRKQPSRYAALLELVAKHHSKTILEIGIYRGRRATEMITAANLHAPLSDIKYYGFDLFEDLTEEDFIKEFSKVPSSKEDIAKELEATKAYIELHQGYTDKTLPAFAEKMKKEGKTIDFAFIDGGHSFETIDIDWKYTEQLMNDDSIVVFDDYYEDDKMTKDKIGCQQVIDNLDRDKYDVEILKTIDTFDKPWGPLAIRFAKVQRRKK